MHVVLLDSFTADQGQGASAWPGLEGLGTSTFYARTAGLDLAQACRDADAIVTNKVAITADLMRALQPRLRYVGVSATGTNIVDVSSARDLGLAVTNVPAYSADSVAQLTIALMLQLSLDVAGHDAAVKRGDWARCPDFCFFLRSMPEWSGKTMAVLGLGAIGTTVANIARAFGMNVIAAALPGRPARADRQPITNVLPVADVVTLHCPLTPQTEKMVNADFLARMKRGALLLNTARGGLVDELALSQALTTGHIGGAGLDVLSTEPPPLDHPLLQTNPAWRAPLVVTPHLGWGTEAARARLRKETVENIAAFARGERRNRVD